MQTAAHPEEPLTDARRQVEAGTPGAAVCRERGSLAAENRQLKPSVADLTLDQPMLQEAWAHRQGGQRACSRPGPPTDNPFTERSRPRFGRRA